jgi:hypothetical protein
MISKTIFFWLCCIVLFPANSTSEEKKTAEILSDIDVRIEKMEISKKEGKNAEKIREKLGKCTKLIKTDQTYPRYAFCRALSEKEPSICMSENDFPDFCRAGAILSEAIKSNGYKLCRKLKVPVNQSLCILLSQVSAEKDPVCDEIKDEGIKYLCELKKSGKSIENNDNLIVRLKSYWLKKNSCICEKEKCRQKPECLESTIVFSAVSAALKGKISDGCRVYLDSNQFDKCPVKTNDKDVVVNPLEKDIKCTAIIKIDNKYQTFIDGIKVPSGIHKIILNSKIKIELESLYCLEPVEDFDFLWFYGKH